MADLGMLEHLGRPAREREAPLLQHHAVVAGLEGPLGVLLDHEHRHPPVAEVAQEGEDLPDEDRGQPDRGLVDEEEPRLEQHGAADLEHLLLAAAEVAGLGVGLLAEMAFSAHDDADLRALTAPGAIPECIAWAVLPRERVLRDYTLELLHALAPQLDRHDLRRVLAGNMEPKWPTPPSWVELSQSLAM